MKSNKIFYVIIFLLILVNSASALSDKEYRQFMKNQNFSEADKALNKAWTNAKNSLSEQDFNALKKSQSRWVKSGRDNEARQLLKKLSRIQAYTLVTNSRADYINNYVKKGLLLLMTICRATPHLICRKIYPQICQICPASPPSSMSRQKLI